MYHYTTLHCSEEKIVAYRFIGWSDFSLAPVLKVSPVDLHPHLSHCPIKSETFLAVALCCRVHPCCKNGFQLLKLVKKKNVTIKNGKYKRKHFSLNAFLQFFKSKFFTEERC